MMVIAGGSGVVKSLGYAWILAPAEFGRLGLVTSLAPFLVYGFGRGAIEGAALNLPRLYGQGRVNEASQLLRHCVKRLTFEGVLATGLSGLVFLQIPAWPFSALPFLLLLPRDCCRLR